MIDSMILISQSQEFEYKINIFRNLIVEWYYLNKRDFPWRNQDTSPYEKIIAEFFLQKTKAENIVEVYKKFLIFFPRIEDLANANQKQIINIIKPLGLYKRRSKLLIQFAKCLLKHYSGEIPTKQEDLLKIPGVGPYIANAYLISQFNYRLPVIDTNFKRLYSRVFSVSMDGDPRRNSFLLEFAEYMLPKNNVREYTFAVLDFSALVCSKNNPKCGRCIFNKICDYYSE